MINGGVWSATRALAGASRDAPPRPRRCPPPDTAGGETITSGGGPSECHSGEWGHGRGTLWRRGGRCGGPRNPPSRRDSPTRLPGWRAGGGAGAAVATHNEGPGPGANGRGEWRLGPRVVRHTRGEFNNKKQEEGWGRGGG